MIPLVSFLIPAFNHANFVVECLNSILQDSYENKEIIIIDDGSHDLTANVIENWIKIHDDEIKVVFRSRPNLGISATLNELTTLAKGEFFRLGASDDYYLPQGTSWLVNYLIEHPSKLAVIGDSIVVDIEGNVVYESGMTGLHGADKRDYATDEGLKKAVIAKWAIAGPVPLLRREAVLGNKGWNAECRIDDWDFFLRIIARDALGFIDCKVCAYRLHDFNTCRTRDVSARIKNLTESSQVAFRNAKVFIYPYDKLLMAQGKLAEAKVAFLKRDWFAMLIHLMAFGKFRIAALVSTGKRR